MATQIEWSKSWRMWQGDEGRWVIEKTLKGRWALRLYGQPAGLFKTLKAAKHSAEQQKTEAL